MADVSDVCQGFVNLIVSTVYPTGTSNPSIVGFPVGVGYGWPIPSSLDASLQNTANPFLYISVYNLPGDKDVTRFQRTWDPPITAPMPTLTAIIAASGISTTVTIGGTITPGNYVSIAAGNQTVSYGVSGIDTLWTITAGLATQFQLPVAVSTTFPNPVISFLSGISGVSTRVAAPQPMAQEIERLHKRFQITIWAQTDTVRNTVAKAIRPALMTPASLLLPDGTDVRVWPVSDHEDDSKERANGYLRDMIYAVEYPTTIGQTQYPVTAPSVTQQATQKYAWPPFTPPFDGVPTTTPQTSSF